jgi:hypothetical protein
MHDRNAYPTASEEDSGKRQQRVPESRVRAESGSEGRVSAQTKERPHAEDPECWKDHKAYDSILLRTDRRREEGVKMLVLKCGMYAH